jgi:hypothetical protein
MTPQDRLDVYVEAIIDQIKDEHKTLSKDLEYVFSEVTEKDRRYLAVRGYLAYPSLGRGTMEANWAFLPGSKIDPDVDKALDKVIEKWVGPDATYSLGVIRDLRPLAQQKTAWNGNKTVKALGGQLLTSLLTEIAKYDDTPTADGLKRLRKFILQQDVGGSSNATPGLSMHGQGRAFDFVVNKGGKSITDISTAKDSIAVWDGPNNWTGRLKDAADAANADLKTGRFDGPLKFPGLYEPWHYTFTKN